MPSVLLTGCTSVKVLLARRPHVKDVAEALQILRESQDPAARIAAYQFLADAGNYPERRVPEDIVVTLSEAWKTEPEPVSRMQALLALRRIEHDRTRQAFLDALGDPDPLVRQTTCDVLGALALPDAVPALAERLSSDVSVDVRLAAANALRRIGTSEAAEALYRSLADADPAVRLRCRQLLADLVGEDHGSDLMAWQQAIRQAEFRPGQEKRRWWPF